MDKYTVGTLIGFTIAAVFLVSLFTTCEAVAEETKACCNVQGYCVVVPKWRICPTGTY